MAKATSQGEQKNDDAQFVTQSKAAAGSRPWLFLGAVAAVVIVFLVIYQQRLDRIVGLIVDDAWYVLLAKALATGQGYSLINSPSPGIMPFYPPVFPFLLSLLYRLSPNFPANLWLLKSLSIAAMFGAGVLAYHYFHRYRQVPWWVALGIGAHTAIYPALVFLATSAVMSECVFTFIQLAAVVAIERCVSDKEKSNHWFWALLGGLLTALAVLTRPVGLGLAIGGVLYLLKEKMPRAVGAFALVVALIAGSWALYARAHAPTAQQRDEQRANIVQPYLTQLFQKTAGQPQSGTISAEDLPDRVFNNLTEIVRYDIGGLAFYPMFRPLEPGESLRVGAESRTLSYVLSALALFGFIALCRKRLTLAELMLPFALLAMLVWGWEQFRLLLPLTPFLIFYLLAGTAELVAFYDKLTGEENLMRRWIPAAGLIWIFFAASVYGNYEFINRFQDPSPVLGSKWLRAFNENEALKILQRQSAQRRSVGGAKSGAGSSLYGA